MSTRHFSTISDYIEQEIEPALAEAPNVDRRALADWMIETGRLEWDGDGYRLYANEELAESDQYDNAKDFWDKVFELDCAPKELMIDDIAAMERGENVKDCKGRVWTREGAGWGLSGEASGVSDGDFIAEYGPLYSISKENA